jgi:arabinan endo-1,5-alpha-L-arabinosidase
VKRLQDIQIRDPFIVPDEKRKLYFLFGTTDIDPWYNPGVGLDCYWSKDLRQWEGPFPAFTPPKGFWGYKHFWAPKVHRYKGRWYMFATFAPRSGCKGVAVLTASSLPGPFVPYSKGMVTPTTWESLSGTLFVDDQSQAWLVFCHEWVQVTDGEICALRLTSDLKAPVGAPTALFRASFAPWTVALDDVGARVLDGPFLYRAKNGKLLMLWSGTCSKGYAQAISRSPSGFITGRWIHERRPLYEADGGCGMLFHKFSGRLTLVCHHPDDTPNERAILVPLREVDGRIILEEKKSEPHGKAL